MTKINKKQIVVIGLTLCLLLALFVGVFLTDTANHKASAETAENSDLRFNLNTAKTAYKVSALNRQLTEANIPDTYNGLPVTEIANNGFMNCANLVSVTIAKSVTKIGSNAFYNCKNLESVYGMAGVNTMGSNVFAMCTKLDNLILPPSITSLGNGIVRGNTKNIYARLSKEEMNAMNPSWDAELAETANVEHGNIIIHEPMMNNGETIGYSIRKWQVLDYQEYVDVPTMHQGLPVFEIQDSAFNLTNCDYLTIKRTENYDYTLNIRSNAFVGNQAKEISIEVNVSFIDSDADGGKSQNVFSGAEATIIKLPDNLTEIPAGTFSFCVNLEQILSTNTGIAANHLPKSVTEIGECAFEYCISLSELYLPDTVTSICDYAFQDWGAEGKKTLYIDRYVPADTWNEFWRENMGEDVNIQYKYLTVVLDKDNGVNGTDHIEVSYGKPLPSATAPERNYYTFDGYYTEPDGAGDVYYDGSMQSSVLWTGTEPIILYAHWNPYTYSVTFNKQSGAGGTDGVIAAYEQSMPEAAAPERTGYDFDGYYTEPNGEGTKYYSANMASAADWTLTRDATLYANWINKTYTLIFDKDGGKGGTTFTTVTYDKPLPSNLVAPVIQYHDFLGYYNGDVKYFNEDMSPAVDLWDIAEDTVLTASWHKKYYTVTLDHQGGSGDSSVTANGNEPMPTAVVPTRLGYTFNGYFSAQNGQGVKYYNDNMTSAHNWDVDDNATLYASWTIITYTITYTGVETQNNPNPTTYTIEDVTTVPLVFAEPTDCGQTHACDWNPSKIDVNRVGDLTVSGTYRIRGLWDNKVIENGHPKYYIYNEKQFLDMNDSKVEMGLTTVFSLEVNLDFGEYTNPCITRAFYGTFEGNGRCIMAFTLDIDDTTSGDCGLFVYNFRYSVIRNVKLYGLVKVSGTNSRNVGMLCGMNLGIIDECWVFGENYRATNQTQAIHCENPNASVGGIVGYVASTAKISYCSNYADIYSNTTTGGIAGKCSDTTTFHHCTNNGDIYVVDSTNKYVGGVIGSLSNASIESCANKANIYIIKEQSGELKVEVGQIIGDALNLKGMTDCTNSGTVYTGVIGNFVEYAAPEIGSVRNI